MRFIARTVIGALIALACVAVVGFGVVSYSSAKQSAGEGRPKRAAPERIYTVRDHTLTPITATPTMQAFGEIGAWRILELRATAAGRIVDIAPDLREGVWTQAGETLVHTLTVLADARSSQTEAEQSFALARADLEAAIGQLRLRRSALERQRDLAARGIAAAATVEAEQLATSSAEQAVVSRRRRRPTSSAQSLMSNRRDATAQTRQSPRPLMGC